MSLLSIDLRHELYKIAQCCTQGLFQGILGGEVEGLEHVPPTGAFIVASNHLSFLDPPTIGSIIQRPIHYFARDSLFKPGFGEWLLTSLNTIPVKRDADSDVTAIKRVFRVLKNGDGLLYFPEGTRSQDSKLQPAKAGLGMIACKTQLPIVPVRIFGSDEVLGRGTGWNLKKSMQVRFGPVLLPEDYDPGKEHEDRYQEASDRAMTAIAKLEPVVAPNY